MWTVKNGIKIAVLSLATLSSNILIAQASYSPDIPQLLPASPEPSLFVTSGLGKTNLSTGANNASIDLYTIKIKDFKFPIDLSYSTQGLKVDEASSRVGYGWVLNATGVVTRSVRGQPDEFSSYLKLPNPASFSANSDSAYNYCYNYSNSTSFDIQPDEFQFHVNGYSGKFIISPTTNQAVLVTVSNVQVSLSITRTPGSSSGSITNMKIVTPDGVIYKFGQNGEYTNTVNIAKYQRLPATKTAFFLDEIDLPTGEVITFSYTPINTQFSTGYSQTMTVCTPLAASSDCGIPPNLCTAAVVNTKTDVMTYRSMYLSQITTSTGLTVNFTYAPRPEQSGDNRLTALSVSANGTGVLKQYAFQYYDVSGSSNQSVGRFFLTKVSDVTLGASANQTMDYVLTYNSLSNVPLPISFSQDYLGYYNGSTTGYFIPGDASPTNPPNYSFRNPNPNFSVIGTLASITYPTGGSETYTYEGNTAFSTVVRDPHGYYTLSGAIGGGTDNSPTALTYDNYAVSIPFNQTVTFDISVTQTAGHPAGLTKTYFSIYQGTTLIANPSLNGYGSNSLTYTLAAGTYHISTQVSGPFNSANWTLTYLKWSSPVYDSLNAAIPGVRVRQIQYTDPITGSSHSKYYTYTTRLQPKWSTGSAPTVDYHSFSQQMQTCNSVTQSMWYWNLDTYSSMSTNQVYNYAGSGTLIYYSNVLESDDPNFANGGTEYIFNPNDNGGNMSPVLNNLIPYLPAGQYPTNSGVLSQKNVFDNQKKLKLTETYQYSGPILSSIPVVYVRQNFDPAKIGVPNRMNAYDVMIGYYLAAWIQQTSVITTKYEGGIGLTTQRSYSYGKSTNILPSKITTTDSQGVIDSTVTRYPNTYKTVDQASIGYAALTAKNIITPPIQQLHYRNGVLLQQKQVYYKDWYGNGSIVEMQKIQLQESLADKLHDAVYYDSCDRAGNVVQLRKANDIPSSYLWDPLLSVPIAEVKGAKVRQVAFTSFENGANGNWTTSGTLNTTTAFAGSNSFTGTVTATVSAAGSYTVTLWTTGTSPTVNGATGSLVTSAKGWNLYRWIISLSSPLTITVNGTTIDDVRLFLTGSLMRTFTFKPFVGIQASSDENNFYTYYGYDVMGRLKSVTDYNGNAVKNYEYHYYNQDLSVLK